MLSSRYKCKNCTNHDFCEACYEDFNGGVLRDFTHRMNPVSKKLEDHQWDQYVSSKDFKSSLKQDSASKAKKVKPNEPCTCGSGKKFKKCCGAA